MKKTLLVAIITGIFLSLLAFAGFFATWNNTLTDNLYGGQPALDHINIISIDDKSLQEIGRWPWNRDTYIPVLEHIDSAEVIGIDIAFFEPELGDAQLAQTMTGVIIAKEYDVQQNIMLRPVQEYAAIPSGVVNIYTDSDGISRRIPLSIAGEPSFSTAIVSQYLNKDISRSESLLVNYAGGPFTFKTYSFIDVLNGNVPAQTFTDSIVLIGATAPDLHDDYIVPTSNGNRMPGVEIHAHAIQTLLTQQYISHQGIFSVIITILALSLITGLLYTYLNITYSAIIIVLIFLAHLISSPFIFTRGIILNLVYPPLALVLTSLTCIAFIALYESHHRKKIRSLFKRYVSKDIVEHLLKNEDAIELGGQERFITAMFADIRGFTALSENMTPHEVITMLNHYFGDMTDLVFKHDGTLDKFIGDCLFAVWGSPLEDEDHAMKAIRCSLEIQHKLKSQHVKGIPKINLGIGLCSGHAVVGNMGSKQRQEFTAIGDTVNTASRMAGQADKGMIVIPEATYNLIKDKVKVKKMEPVKVKNKKNPIQIYNVVGLKQ